MSKFDELCEDIRIAYVNEGSYRFLFVLIGFLKGLLTLSVVAGCAAGIWYLMYGFDNRHADPVVKEIIGGSSASPVAEQTAREQLSTGRIAQLREFANNNRDLGISRGDTQLEEPSRQSVDLPVAAVVEMEQLEESTGPVVELDGEVRSVFDDLEKKLTGKPGEGSGSLAKLVSPERTESSASDQVEADPVEIVAVAAPPAPAAESESAVAAVDNTGSSDATGEVGIRDSDWVMARGGDDYLIQIGSTTNRPFLFRFEKQLPDTHPTAIFEMLIGRQPEYTLTYGVFDSREEASAELSSLSQAARRYGAYVRKISAVQLQVQNLDKDLAVAQKTAN